VSSSILVLGPSVSAPVPAWAYAVREAAALYRPRRPERTSFYALLERHFEDYTRVHSERYEPKHGPLRRVVRKSVEQFLDCGRYHAGFARLRCSNCKAEHLVAFSCQTRNFCPSCQAKRAALFAEHFVEVVRLPVPHRHVVLTVPKALRRLFERDRRLLSLLSRSAYKAIRRGLQELLGRRDALPGVAASIQTFGSFGNWNPHVHALVTDGLVERGGRFLPVGGFPTGVIEQHFRRLVLRGLRRAERLSEAFEETLLGWEHSGFSAHAGTAIEANDPKGVERVGRYLTRAPMALGKVHPQKDGRVRLLTPPDPKTGKDSRLFDPLDWVHAVTTQIPDPRQHMVRYYGAYANRSRRLYRPGAEEAAGRAGPAACEPRPDEDDQDAWVQARRRSWARLIARIYEVDPLVCPRCGHELKIVAAITDPVLIDRILEHRRRAGLRSPFQPRAPPAD
jgi:Putative transposase/Transposase zinc-binding domain